MAATDMKYYVFGGTYASKADALKALDAVKELHRAGRVKSFEGAVYDKDAKGNLKVVRWENPREAKAVGWGVLTGAVVGLFFPAALLGVVGVGVVGGLIGALAGDLSKDFGRGYIKSMGDKLDKGRFGVIVVAHAMPNVSAAAVLPGAADALKKEVTGRRVAAELKKKEKVAAKAAAKPAAKPAAKAAAKPAAKAPARAAAKPAAKAPAKAAAKPAAKKPAAKPAAKAAAAKKAAPARAAAKPAAKPATRTAAAKKPVAAKPASKPAAKPAAKKPAAKPAAKAAPKPAMKVAAKPASKAPAMKAASKK